MEWREKWSCNEPPWRPQPTTGRSSKLGWSFRTTGLHWMLAAVKKGCVFGQSNFLEWNQFPKKADWWLAAVCGQCPQQLGEKILQSWRGSQDLYDHLRTTYLSAGEHLPGLDRAPSKLLFSVPAPFLHWAPMVLPLKWGAHIKFQKGQPSHWIWPISLVWLVQSFKIWDFVVNVQKIGRLPPNSRFLICLEKIEDLATLSLNPFKATVIRHVTSPHQACSPYELLCGWLLGFEQPIIWTWLLSQLFRF